MLRSLEGHICFEGLCVSAGFSALGEWRTLLRMCSSRCCGIPIGLTPAEGSPVISRRSGPESCANDNAENSISRSITVLIASLSKPMLRLLRFHNRLPCKYHSGGATLYTTSTATSKTKAQTTISELLSPHQRKRCVSKLAALYQHSLPALLELSS